MAEAVLIGPPGGAANRHTLLPADASWRRDVGTARKQPWHTAVSHPDHSHLLSQLVTNLPARAAPAGLADVSLENRTSSNNLRSVGNPLMRGFRYAHKAGVEANRAFDANSRPVGPSGNGAVYRTMYRGVGSVSGRSGMRHPPVATSGDFVRGTAFFGVEPSLNVPAHYGVERMATSGTTAAPSHMSNFSKISRYASHGRQLFPFIVGEGGFFVPRVPATSGRLSPPPARQGHLLQQRSPDPVNRYNSIRDPGVAKVGTSCFGSGGGGGSSSGEGHRVSGDVAEGAKRPLYRSLNCASNVCRAAVFEEKVLRDMSRDRPSCYDYSPGQYASIPGRFRSGEFGEVLGLADMSLGTAVASVASVAAGGPPAPSDPPITFTPIFTPANPALLIPALRRPLLTVGLEANPLTFADGLHPHVSAARPTPPLRPLSSLTRPLSTLVTYSGRSGAATGVDMRATSATRGSNLGDPGRTSTIRAPHAAGQERMRSAPHPSAGRGAKRQETSQLKDICPRRQPHEDSTMPSAPATAPLALEKRFAKPATTPLSPPPPGLPSVAPAVAPPAMRPAPLRRESSASIYVRGDGGAATSKPHRSPAPSGSASHGKTVQKSRSPSDDRIVPLSITVTSPTGSGCSTVVTPTTDFSRGSHPCDPSGGTKTTPGGSSCLPTAAGEADPGFELVQIGGVGVCDAERPAAGAVVADKCATKTLCADGAAGKENSAFAACAAEDTAAAATSQRWQDRKAEAPYPEADLSGGARANDAATIDAHAVDAASVIDASLASASAMSFSSAGGAATADAASRAAASARGGGGFTAAIHNPSPWDTPTIDSVLPEVVQVSGLLSDAGADSFCYDDGAGRSQVVRTATDIGTISTLSLSADERTRVVDDDDDGASIVSDDEEDEFHAGAAPEGVYGQREGPGTPGVALLAPVGGGSAILAAGGAAAAAESLTGAEADDAAGVNAGTPRKSSDDNRAVPDVDPPTKISTHGIQHGGDSQNLGTSDSEKAVSESGTDFSQTSKLSKNGDEATIFADGPRRTDKAATSLQSRGSGDAFAEEQMQVERLAREQAQPEKVQPKEAQLEEVQTEVGRPEMRDDVKGATSGRSNSSPSASERTREAEGDDLYTRERSTAAVDLGAPDEVYSGVGSDSAGGSSDVGGGSGQILSAACGSDDSARLPERVAPPSSFLPSGSWRQPAGTGSAASEVDMCSCSSRSSCTQGSLRGRTASVGAPGAGSGGWRGAGSRASRTQESAAGADPSLVRASSLAASASASLGALAATPGGSSGRPVNTARSSSSTASSFASASAIPWFDREAQDRLPSPPSHILAATVPRIAAPAPPSPPLAAVPRHIITAPPASVARQAVGGAAAPGAPVRIMGPFRPLSPTALERASLGKSLPATPHSIPEEEAQAAGSDDQGKFDAEAAGKAAESEASSEGKSPPNGAVKNAGQEAAGATADGSPGNAPQDGACDVAEAAADDTAEAAADDTAAGTTDDGVENAAGDGAEGDIGDADGGTAKATGDAATEAMAEGGSEDANICAPSEQLGSAIDDAAENSLEGAADDAVEGTAQGTAEGAAELKLEIAAESAVGDAVESEAEGGAKCAAEGRAAEGAAEGGAAGKGAIQDAARGAVESVVEGLTESSSGDVCRGAAGSVANDGVGSIAGGSAEGTAGGAVEVAGGAAAECDLEVAEKDVPKYMSRSAAGDGGEAGCAGTPESSRESAANILPRKAAETPSEIEDGGLSSSGAGIFEGGETDGGCKPSSEDEGQEKDQGIQAEEQRSGGDVNQHLAGGGTPCGEVRGEDIREPQLERPSIPQLSAEEGSGSVAENAPHSPSSEAGTPDETFTESGRLETASGPEPLDSTEISAVVEDVGAPDANDERFPSDTPVGAAIATAPDGSSDSEPGSHQNTRVGVDGLGDASELSADPDDALGGTTAHSPPVHPDDADESDAEPAADAPDPIDVFLTRTSLVKKLSADRESLPPEASKDLGPIDTPIGGLPIGGLPIADSRIAQVAELSSSRSDSAEACDPRCLVADSDSPTTDFGESLASPADAAPVAVSQPWAAAPCDVAADTLSDEARELKLTAHDRVLPNGKDEGENAAVGPQDQEDAAHVDSDAGGQEKAVGSEGECTAGSPLSAPTAVTVTDEIETEAEWKADLETSCAEGRAMIGSAVEVVGTCLPEESGAAPTAPPLLTTTAPTTASPMKPLPSSSPPPLVSRPLPFVVGLVQCIDLAAFDLARCPVPLAEPPHVGSQPQMQVRVAVVEAVLRLPPPRAPRFRRRRRGGGNGGAGGGGGGGRSGGRGEAAAGRGGGAPYRGAGGRGGNPARGSSGNGFFGGRGTRPRPHAAAV